MSRKERSSLCWAPPLREVYTFEHHRWDSSINSGHVLLNGVEVTSPNKIVPIEKRDLNMVFQDFALWPHMTARENILYGLKLRKATRQEQEENLQKMVDLLHLNGLMDQYPAELSGGQQQRVAIARALIMSPSIILLMNRCATWMSSCALKCAPKWRRSFES